MVEDPDNNIPDPNIPNGTPNQQPTFEEQQRGYERRKRGFDEEGYDSLGYNERGLDKEQQDQLDLAKEQTPDRNFEQDTQDKVKINRDRAQIQGENARRRTMEERQAEAEKRRKEGRAMGKEVAVAGGITSALGASLDIYPNLTKMVNGFFSGSPMGMTDAILGGVFSNIESIQNNIQRPGGLAWGIEEGADIAKLSETPYGQEYLKASDASRNGSEDAMRNLDDLYEDLNRRGPNGGGTPGAGMWTVQDMDSAALQMYYDGVTERMASVDDALINAKGQDRYRLLAEKSVYMETLNKIQERAKDIDTTSRRQVRDVHKAKVRLGAIAAEMNKQAYESNKQYRESREDFFLHNEKYNPDPNMGALVSQMASTLNVNKAEEIYNSGIHIDPNDPDHVIQIHPSRIHSVYWSDVEKSLKAAMDNPGLTDEQRDAARKAFDYFEKRVETYRTNPQKDAEALANADTVSRMLAKANGFTGYSQLSVIDLDEFGYPVDQEQYDKLYDELARNNGLREDGESLKDYNERELALNHMERNDFIINNILPRLDLTDDNDAALWERYVSSCAEKDPTAKDISSYMALMDIMFDKRVRTDSQSSDWAYIHQPDISTFSERVTSRQVRTTNWQIVHAVENELNLDRTEGGQTIREKFKEINRVYRNKDPDLVNAIKVKWLEEHQDELDVYVKGTEDADAHGQFLGDFLSKFHLGVFDGSNLDPIGAERIDASVVNKTDKELYGFIEKLKGLNEAVDADNPADGLITAVLNFDKGSIDKYRDIFADHDRIEEFERIYTGMNRLLNSNSPKTASATEPVMKKAIYLPFNRAYPRHVDKVPEMPPIDKVKPNPYTVAEPPRIGFDESRASRAAVKDAYLRFCRMAELDYRYKDSYDLFMSVSDDAMRSLMGDVNVANNILNVRDHAPTGFWYDSGLGKRDKRDPSYRAWQKAYREEADRPDVPSMEGYQSHIPEDPRSTPSEVLMDTLQDQDPYVRFKELLKTRHAIDMMEDLRSDGRDSYHQEVRRRFAEGLEADAAAAGMDVKSYMEKMMTDVMYAIRDDMRNNAARLKDKGRPKDDISLADAYDFVLKNKIGKYPIGEVIKDLGHLSKDPSGGRGRMYAKAYTRYLRTSKDAENLRSEYQNIIDMAMIYERHVRDNNHSVQISKELEILMPDTIKPRSKTIVEKIDPKRYTEKDLATLRRLRVPYKEKYVGQDGIVSKQGVGFKPLGVTERAKLDKEIEKREAELEAQRKAEGKAKGSVVSKDQKNAVNEEASTAKPGMKKRSTGSKGPSKKNMDRFNELEAKSKTPEGLNIQEREEFKKLHKIINRTKLKEQKEVTKKINTSAGAADLYNEEMSKERAEYQRKQEERRKKEREEASPKTEASQNDTSSQNDTNIVE